MAGLFAGGTANVSWARALEGLSAEDAVRVAMGLPHSVAQVVAHVQFWQAWLLASVNGQQPAWPEHAASGWPDPQAAEWASLVDSFLRDQAVLADLALDATRTAERLPDGRTLADSLVGFAGHGVYHLGQVVLLRQALGVWPPPSGGDTW